VPFPLRLRAGVAEAYPDVLTPAAYPDVLTPAALAGLEALAPFEQERRDVMRRRLERRAARHRGDEPLGFLEPGAVIPRTRISVADARDARFGCAPVPADLRRQWIQGTGPAAKPRATVEQSLRNPADALLSGADGWMFDGEDALGQLSTMSLDNQRSLRLALARDSRFLAVAESVAAEMNAWSTGFFGRRIVANWSAQLEMTTAIFRPRGLHLDDRHVACFDRTGFGASFVDAALYVSANAAALRGRGRTVVLYLPKIQTAEEAALWNEILLTLEERSGLDAGAIRTYVLVEQLEAAFQLMEIRAALAPRFLGFNTGRWDYINSVADALAGDPSFVDPNIEHIAMTYGYLRAYEDRVRRAANTADARGECSLWQGGMEPQSRDRSVRLGLRRRRGGRRGPRERAAGGRPDRGGPEGARRAGLASGLTGAGPHG